MNSKAHSCLAFALALLLCVLTYASTRVHSVSAATAPIDTVTGLSHSVEAQPEIMLLLGLGLQASVARDIKATFRQETSHLPSTIVDLEQTEPGRVAWPSQGVLVAAGVEGCELASAQSLQVPVVCTLLTEENFQRIHQRQNDNPLLSALVIDQPVRRQAQIANTVYPALSRFAVVTNNEFLDVGSGDLTVDVQRYRSYRSLAPQLESAIRSHDALIAVPQHEIYNRSTLQTVLLTAYGYGKPVVGLSQGYVNAGALITCYTTPAQIFRQLAEILAFDNWMSIGERPLIQFPSYFSIADNVNVARSLGLTKLFDFDAQTTYTDGDFSL